jgi:SAM-dependent methyltransferase
MFSESAALYDLIYGSIKDYAAEAGRVAALIHSARPGCRTVLDVGCGTAEHARVLGEAHGFEVDGIDLDPALLAIAQSKCPCGRFELADMVGLHLGRSYDAVLCLFGTIAYAETLPRLQAAICRLREHVVPSGVVIVEPFLTPDGFKPGVTGSLTAEAGAVRVTRTHRSERDGSRCRLYFDYVVEGSDGVRHASEVHELGLFPVEDMLAAFTAAGLVARHDPQGLSGRGSYVATVAP